MTCGGGAAAVVGAGFAPIAVADRNGVDESVHFGAAVVIGQSGRAIASIGDPDLAFYPRSALKPLQAAAMVELGLDLPAHLLALVAASHSGEQFHLDGVVEILDTHGLSVGDLRNTAARPYGSAARSAARAAGVEPSPLQQNCSGKHAGMLATCRINGWPIDTYLDIDHPLQRAIVGTLATLGAEVSHVGIDGCGAPTHVVALSTLAGAFRRLVLDGSAVATSMVARPDMVGGSDRDVTTWMRAVPGLVAKEGADGVMALALADGSAAALKIADGSDRARQAVTVELLRRLGVDVDGALAETRDQVEVTVLGHGHRVGALRPLPWP